jgi:hypothetical protein
MTDQDIITTIEQAFAKAELLGDIFAWSVRIPKPGVTPDEVQAAAKAAGLAEDYVPNVPGPETAARRAVTEVARGHKADFSVVLNQPGALVWAVVETQVEQDSRIGDQVGTLANRVLYDRNTCTLHVEHETQLTADLLAAWQRHRDYLTRQDVRDMTVAVLRDCEAVRLWGTGAQYFVPARHASISRALRDVLCQLGESEAGVIPVPRVDEAQAAIGVAAKRSLHEEIGKLRDEMGRWVDGSRKPRASTLETRVAEYAALRQRAEDVQLVLATTTHDITGAIDELHDACMKMMGVEPEPKPEPEPTVDAPDEGSTSEPTPPARPVKPGENAHTTMAQEGLAQLSVRELRRLAKHHGVSTSGLNKASLVAALEAVQ